MPSTTNTTSFLKLADQRKGPLAENGDDDKYNYEMQESL